MGTLGQLNTQHFANLIRKYGVTPVSWYQRIGKCPRSHVALFTGFTPDNGCPLCGGTGTLYRAMPLPLDSVLTGGRVLANVINIRRHTSPVDLQVGDMALSFVETEYPFAEGDKLVLNNRVADHSQEIERGTGAGDRLRYSPCIQVTAVYVAGGEFPGDSYAISQDGAQLLFSGAEGPSGASTVMAAGTKYTVRYRYRPPFMIVQGSFVRRPTATNGDLFPTDCVIRIYSQLPTDRKEDQP